MKNRSTPEEKYLIRQARAGNEAAFGRLVERHTPGLFRVVYRAINDTVEAEAIVQETFLRAWESIRRRRYREDERPLFSYLVTIALNLARDRFRRERWLDFSGLEQIAESMPAPEAGPEAQVEKAEMLAALAAAVTGLPPAYRAVIALRYDAGMSYQEISEILGLPLNTVRTHLSRAKANLRRRIETKEI